jgi:signal transduction histidine kinase
MLPASYAGLHIRAQIRPQMAEMLLIGGVPASRVPLLLILLLVAVGLTAWAALQLRREVQFATERANFVANVSHELRTPLAQVRLVLDTLKLGRGGDAEARDAALGIADREVLRLQHLVEGVLQFTRGVRADSPKVRTDVSRDARTIVQEFMPLAAARGVTVDVQGDEGVMAMLQTGALRQVLVNLLDNAVKYGGANAPVVVGIHAREGGGARIAVSDSGPGVPAADRVRIWQAFERGRLARSQAVGGSGIGLTIVQQLAQVHGGRAWVEDAPTGGARFVFEVPDDGGSR